MVWVDQGRLEFFFFDFGFVKAVGIFRGEQSEMIAAGAATGAFARRAGADFKHPTLAALPLGLADDAGGRHGASQRPDAIRGWGGYVKVVYQVIVAISIPIVLFVSGDEFDGIVVLNDPLHVAFVTYHMRPQAAREHQIGPALSIGAYGKNCHNLKTSDPK
jgi:hypothetical protein